MKFSTTRKSIELYAENHDFEINFQQLEHDVKSHKEYLSALAYVEGLQNQDVSLVGFKVSENNIQFLPFPLLCVLQSYHHGSVFTYVDRNEKGYVYYKGDDAYPVSQTALEKLWLGSVFFEEKFLETQDIFIEENKVENNIVVDNKTFYGSVIGMRNHLINKSESTNFFVNIIGNDNEVVIHEEAELNIREIRMRGNGNRVVIGKHCRIRGSFVLEGGSSKVFIGDHTTVEEATFSATESRQITIGSDCMFSIEIAVKTSDSHSVIDLETGERMNPAQDVIIEDHVWVAPNAKILKGVTVGEGSIIGIGSVVTKSIPKNTLAAGTPAKPIKSNVSWDRELL